MAKDKTFEQKTLSPEEQLQAAVEAKRAATLEKQAALDEAASFKTMVTAGQKSVADVKECWLMFLDAVKRCDDVVKEQSVAASVAREHAAANDLPTNAVELGHGPLVATSMANMSDVPWPCVHKPTLYVAQFGTIDALWMNIIMALNQGAPVIASGMNNEQIAKALLAGVSVSELQSRGAQSPAVEKLNSDSGNWFGFRPTKAA